MTLGNKLSKLRKENNYTQEQLADILGVSRQAISKWESDAAFPETEKLLKLGELYQCSMDYLLKDEIEEEAPKSSSETIIIHYSMPTFEKKSKRTFHGLPLWHINIGYGRTAKGVIAIGTAAKGLISIGLFSLGLLSFGVCSLGLLSTGVLAIGALSMGSFSIGLIALGALNLGIIAVGALSVGDFSVGALAIGKYFSFADNARAMIAIGKTEASGSLFQKLGTLTPQDTAAIKELLDANVPFYLSWAKELIKLFL